MSFFINFTNFIWKLVYFFPQAVMPEVHLSELFKAGLHKLSWRSYGRKKFPILILSSEAVIQPNTSFEPSFVCSSVLICFKEDRRSERKKAIFIHATIFQPALLFFIVIASLCRRTKHPTSEQIFPKNISFTLLKLAPW